MENIAHPDLQSIRSHLIQIHDAISNFKPLTARPPILDSSCDSTSENDEENQWLNQEDIPGLKKLKETVKLDLGVLEKVIPWHRPLLINQSHPRIAPSSSWKILTVQTCQLYLRTHPIL